MSALRAETHPIYYPGPSVAQGWDHSGYLMSLPSDCRLPYFILPTLCGVAIAQESLSWASYLQSHGVGLEPYLPAGPWWPRFSAATPGRHSPECQVRHLLLCSGVIYTICRRKRSHWRSSVLPPQKLEAARACFSLFLLPQQNTTGWGLKQ